MVGVAEGRWGRVDRDRGVGYRSGGVGRGGRIE